ncbi:MULTISPECIES: hypothetical protein [Peribacillus]|uniref:hypothetical protein n=1 Tax=Peribacillus TaxID=2675229 RepID=UPI00351E3431
MNFGSNIAALIIFLSMVTVNFAYGIPMGLVMVAGALVGTNFAIKKGASYVRILFICVTILLMGKMSLIIFVCFDGWFPRMIPSKNGRGYKSHFRHF